MAIKKSTKASALLFCLLFCFAMAFSIFFLASEADHACPGEDCTVCSEVRVCASVLGSAVMVPASAAVCAAIPLRLIRVAHYFDAEAVPFTLVSWKVKLSN